MRMPVYVLVMWTVRAITIWDSSPYVNEVGNPGFECSLNKHGNGVGILNMGYLEH